MILQITDKCPWPIVPFEGDSEGIFGWGPRGFDGGDYDYCLDGSLEPYNGGPTIRRPDEDR